jgi:hypothetical protein
VIAFNLDQPDQPTLVGPVIESFASWLDYKDNLLVIGVTSSFKFYNIDDPLNPIEINEYPLVSGRFFLTGVIYNDHLIVSDSRGGENAAIRVLDISDPENPIVLKVGTRAWSDGAYHLRIIDETLVECATNSIRSLDIAQLIEPGIVGAYRNIESGEGRGCVADGKNIVLNGKVFNVDDIKFDQLAEFEPISSQPDALSYGSLARRGIIFIPQHGLVQVLSANGVGQNKLFPQIADGGGYVFELVLTNPGKSTETATLYFRDSAGDPLELVLEGNTIAQSAVDIEIPPGGSLNLKTLGSGNLKTGYAQLYLPNSSSSVVSVGQYYFKGKLAVSVQNVESSKKYHVFVEKDLNVDSGITLVNMAGDDSNCTLTLRDENGDSLDNLFQTLESYGQIAKFFTELFPRYSSSLNFVGSLHVSCFRPFGMAGFRQQDDGTLGSLIASPSSF